MGEGGLGNLNTQIQQWGTLINTYFGAQNNFLIKTLQIHPIEKVKERLFCNEN